MTQRDEQSFAQASQDLRERVAARPFINQILRGALGDQFGCASVRVENLNARMGPVLSGQTSSGASLTFHTYLAKPDLQIPPELRACCPGVDRRQVVAQAFANEKAALQSLKGAENIIPYVGSQELDIRGERCGVIALERFEGRRLDAILSETRGPMEQKEARAIAEDILFALAFCEKAGWVHGAVHPPNILVREGAPAMLDNFGSAIPEGSMRADVLSIGEREYAPPELLEETGRPITAKADTYGLKRVRDYMLMGQLSVEAWKEDLARTWR